MIELTDTDGKKLLLHEHYVVRVGEFDASQAPGVEFGRRPRSVVVDATGAVIPVLETLEDIAEKLRGF